MLNGQCRHGEEQTFGKWVYCKQCGTTHSFEKEEPLAQSRSYGVIKDPAYNSRADIPPPQLMASMLQEQGRSRCYNPNANYIPVYPNV
jgi:hypothetical protein